MELVQEEWETVRSSRLFSGVGEGKLHEMLSCLQARRREYGPGETVIREGELVSDVGLVLSGQARSLKAGRTGEPLIVSLLGRGSFLGVLLAASRDRRSPVSVQAQESLAVLFFPAERLIGPCEKNCPEHSLLFRNFLDSVAEKSLTLNDRIDCLIRPTVREKVLAYLTQMAAGQGAPPGSGRGFSIPLDRNAMAGYLNVERSALSRELSRMRADGLIRYHKNQFQLF